MVVIDGRTWMEVLTEAECWRQLEDVPIGRLAVLVDSTPEIYPVNFIVDEESLVFRTAKGSKLGGVDRSPSVCFEVDGFDPEARTGWSVVVKGHARAVTGPAERSRLVRIPLDYWAMGEKSAWVRIVPTQVTGRRIHQRSAEPSG